MAPSSSEVAARKIVLPTSAPAILTYEEEFPALPAHTTTTDILTYEEEFPALPAHTTITDILTYEEEFPALPAHTTTTDILTYKEEFPALPAHTTTTDVSVPITTQKGLALLALLSLPVISAGLSLINKRALKEGMDFRVLCIYRNVIASCLMVPLSLRYDRPARAEVTWNVVFRLVALAILEPVLDQQFAYAGLQRMPASSSSALGLLQPVVLFIMCWSLRRERVTFSARPSQAKLAGVLIGGVGVVVVLASPAWTNNHSAKPTTENLLEGATLGFVGIFAAASYMLVLIDTVDAFNHPVAITASICVLGAVVNAVMAPILGTRHHQSYMRLTGMTALAYFYSGLVVSALSNFLFTIVSKNFGAVTTGAIGPFSMLIVTLFSKFVLREEVVMISWVAMVFVMFGMGMILCGKYKEEMYNSQRP